MNQTLSRRETSGQSGVPTPTGATRIWSNAVDAMEKQNLPSGSCDLSVKATVQREGFLLSENVLPPVRGGDSMPFGRSGDVVTGDETVLLMR